MPSLYDELRGADGEERPEWRALMACLEALGPEELALRYEDGRRLERGQHVARLVAAGVADAERGALLLLEPLLEIADSVVTYRRRYFAEPQLPGVLDLLLRDPTNSRSLAFQLAASERLAGDLPARAEPDRVADVGARLAGLSARLAAADDAELGASLNFFAEELGAISDWLTRIFFSHVVSRVS